MTSYRDYLSFESRYGRIRVIQTREESSAGLENKNDRVSPVKCELLGRNNKRQTEREKHRKVRRYTIKRSFHIRNLCLTCSMGIFI